ncbi:cytochrome c-type biogenesis protein CcmH [Rhodobacteraceae bacterium NNCM2]|nr:cytochrome c-type biogenesis protein CcmH [Coraliihabitans acroporae]
MMLVAALIATAAPAVQPDEVLSDPVLEARAREITKEVRCLVCRNESIDDSNAGLARDLRILVRERLVAGDSDAEVMDFLVARYGEFVLLRPRFNAGNLVLWLAGPLIFVIGLVGVFFFLRGRKVAPAQGEAPLSDDEQREVERLLKG